MIFMILSEICFSFLKADNDPFTQTAIESFTIEYFIYGNSLSRSAVTIDDPNTRTIVITGLMKGTTYGVRIQTSNSAGPSNYSTPVTQRTDIDGKCLLIYHSLIMIIPFWE